MSVSATRTVRVISTVVLCLLVAFLVPPLLDTAAAVEPWEQVVGQGAQGTPGSGPGFGDKDNTAAIPMVKYDGKLYVGTSNGRGAQVWAWDGAGWERKDGGVFGNAGTVLRMHTYNGHLYAGTVDGDGCGVWRYDGSRWTDMLSSTYGQSPGFGNKSNLAVTAMEVFEGRLYVGIANLTAYYVSGGSEIWSFNGASWSVEQSSRRGFSDTRNAAVTSLKAYKGSLYAGTAKMSFGFRWIDSDHVEISIKSAGCELRKKSGDQWLKISDNGFTDKNNLAVTAMEVYGERLIAGTMNAGMSIVYEISSGDVSIPGINTKGLCVYAYDGTSVRPLATGGFESVRDFSVVSMRTAGGRLLVGTAGSDGTGKLRAFNGTAWSVAARDDFDDEKNGAVSGLEKFNGYIYAGTLNLSEGCEVFRQVLPPESEAKPEKKPKQTRTEGRSTWYLAEGSTSWGFTTYISIENPNDKEVVADITYMTSEGPVSGGATVLPAMSQATINPNQVIPYRDFSTKVKCRGGETIAVDRTMSWVGEGASAPEGHSSVGVHAPSKTWYLPEGSSAWGFECWLLIQNPGRVEAACDVTYMIEGEGPVTVRKTVPAASRKTFNMKDDIGEKDASIMVEASVPVIPERAMYRNKRRGGHCSIGTTKPATDYYLPEGTTAWGFLTYVLIQNPNDTPVSVDLVYMTESGPIGHPENPVRMPANSRKTIRVNDFIKEKDLSTRVHSESPIVAERAMYWDSGSGEACHDSIGMPAAHSTFYLPDGQTSQGMETFTLVQNPNGYDVEVNISYLTPTGRANPTFRAVIPANSRRTFNMIDSGYKGRAAVLVKTRNSRHKIIAERAMYWFGRGAGTGTIGGYSD